MGLLNALGINLPGLLGGNPFSALTGAGGPPVPPTVVGQGFKSLIPALTQALSGNLGQQSAAPAQAQSGAKVPVAQPSAPVQAPAMFIPPPKTQQVPSQSSQPAGEGEVEAYIRNSAAQRGINPDVAVRVARGEGGLKDPYRHGEGPAPSSQDRSLGAKENSYGPFQLYVSGTGAGLGDRALQAGINPQKDWKRGVDFALNEVSQKGWGQWYGAKAQGITGMMGVNGGKQVPVGPASMASQAPTFNALSAPSGQSVAPGANVQGVPAVNGQGVGFDQVSDGNTALADPGNQASGRGRGGMPDGSPASPKTGGTVHNSLSQDYKRYAARRTTDHLRALSPVATIQTLANIGKGLQVNGGGSTS